MRLDTGITLLFVLASFGSANNGPDDDIDELLPAFDITNHTTVIKERSMWRADPHCAGLLPLRGAARGGHSYVREVSSICLSPAVIKATCQWRDESLQQNQRVTLYICPPNTNCFPSGLASRTGLNLAHCLRVSGPRKQVRKWNAPRASSSQAKIAFAGADGSLRRILATNFYQLSGEENRTEAIIAETDWIALPSGMSEGVDYNQTNPVSDPVFANTTQAVNVTVTPGGSHDLADVTVYSYWAYY